LGDALRTLPISHPPSDMVDWESAWGNRCCCPTLLHFPGQPFLTTAGQTDLWSHPLWAVSTTDWSRDRAIKTDTGNTVGKKKVIGEQ